MNTDNDKEEIFSKYGFFELNIRYGLSQRCDIGAELAFPPMVNLDTKYQFVGDDSSHIACSAGFGLGTIPLSDYLGGIGILLPLYASYHPSRKLAIYMSPRLYSSFAKESVPQYYAGISSGVKLGEDGALVLEYSCYTNFENDNELISQFVAALSYKIP